MHKHIQYERRNGRIEKCDGIFESPAHPIHSAYPSRVSPQHQRSNISPRHAFLISQALHFPPTRGNALTATNRLAVSDANPATFLSPPQCRGGS